MSAPPNPAIATALRALEKRNGALGDLRIADQGCGMLRHYRLLAPLARELFLIDTESQVTSRHRDGNHAFTIEEFARAESRGGSRIVRVLRDHEFEDSSLGLDLVFSIAVFDVVLPQVRRRLVRAGANNLKAGGYFVLIIPRNDSSILTRCTRKNQYRDGYLFAHHGVYTFFSNFRTTDAAARICRKVGLDLVEDLSSYRQVCLLFHSK